MTLTVKYWGFSAGVFFWDRVPNLALERWSLILWSTMGRVRPSIITPTPVWLTKMCSPAQLAALRPKEAMVNWREAVKYLADTPITTSASTENALATMRYLVLFSAPRTPRWTE